MAGLKLYLFSTGGTIEKVYSEQRGSGENADAKLERYLARLRQSGRAEGTIFHSCPFT